MKYLNTKQVASLFNVDNSTIRRWTLTNKLKCTSSNGGHRRFSFKNIIKFIKTNPKKLSLNLDLLGLIDMKKSKAGIINDIVKNALNMKSHEIEALLIRLYLKGNTLGEIFDNFINQALDEIQALLDNKKISVAEEHISRKTISKSLFNFRDSIKKEAQSTNLTALCLNLENDVPDLAIDMIQIILESKNYTVHNSGSHTSVENLKLILEKYKFNSLYIYMCNRQCCTSTVKNHLENTIESLEKISRLCKKHTIKLYIGGPSTLNIDKIISFNYNKFSKFSEISKH